MDKDYVMRIARNNPRTASINDRHSNPYVMGNS